ncbi:MAG: glycerophosphodiester phosphodiesterase family protein [Bacilli bacterium]|nr:glycerophosphodiester phosphodiesterase family protein [Bacilli bacterium]
MSYIIAHRGFSSIAPENSLKAIKKALEKDYIDGIEIDVRMTKDNKIVLIHDRNIKNVSNGKGEVYNYTFEELLHYDFHPNRVDQRRSYLKSFFSLKGRTIRKKIRKNRKERAKLSSLEDIIKLFDKKILIIELKKDGTDFKDFIDSFVKILLKHKDKKIYIKSFNTNLLLSLKEKDPDLLIGILIGKKENINKIDLPVDFISIKHKLVDNYVINEVNKQQKKLMVWTVDNYFQYNKLIKYKNIKDDIFLISNYPDIINDIKNKIN